MILDGLIQYLLAPSTLINLLLMLGISFSLFGIFKKASRWLFIAALLIFFVIGSGPVSSYLMKSLEYRYAKLGDEIYRQDIKVIVVLAGYAENKSSMPESARINAASSYRIIEAASIFRQQPESRTIWITGQGEVPALMKAVLVNMGVPEALILIDNQSASTLESARNMASQVGQEAFFLVTSAGHMPRAVNAFKKQQLNPVAAPTHYLIGENILEAGYLPTPLHLQLADQAVREYLAIFRDSMQ